MLNLSIFSVGGCRGQPMLLFRNLFDETQMLNIEEHANHHECLPMQLKPTVIMILNLLFCTGIPHERLYRDVHGYPVVTYSQDM